MNRTEAIGAIFVGLAILGGLRLWSVLRAAMSRAWWNMRLPARRREQRERDLDERERLLAQSIKELADCLRPSAIRPPAKVQAGSLPRRPE